ncbi:MAG: putative domain HDIG-containing protein [Rhodocyclaceae bacterium]|nr:putative domain HDIG-containing protein [Rhodocyclaceae bacterium]
MNDRSTIPAAPSEADAAFVRSLRVLYVEDQEEIRELLARFLTRRVARLDVAEDGEEGAQKFVAGEYDVVVTDIKMPRLDGLEMIERIKATGRSVPIIVVTAYSDRDFLLRAIELGVDRYVTKPVDPDLLVHAIQEATRERARQRDLLAAQRRILEILQQTVMALGRAIEMRDPYIDGHQKRVSLLAEAIGRELGMAPDEIEGIRFAALIHDIGSIRIPSEIICRPGPLNPMEYAIVKGHPKAGFELVQEVDFPWPIGEMILQHHERLDGSGYPRGLKGDEILPAARILAVADVVEAMSSHRPYRPALGIAKAQEELQSGRGRLFDPAAVDACIRILDARPDILSAKRPD